MGRGPNSPSAREYVFDASIVTFATSAQTFNVLQNKGEHAMERTAAGFSTAVGRYPPVSSFRIMIVGWLISYVTFRLDDPSETPRDDPITGSAGCTGHGPN